MKYNLLSNVPPLECLIAALVAARTGSFSQAAIEIGVSHAAISRRISTAEAWAGTKLFLRHGRGVRPTDDGQRLLGRVAYALDTIDQSALSWRKRQQARLVRIATTHSLAEFWLYPRLAEIEQALPNVRLEISVSFQNVDLDGKDADIAIRCGKGGWKIGPEARLFPEELIRPICSPQFYETNKKALESEAIMSLPLIHNFDVSGWQAYAQARSMPFKAKLSDRVCSDYQLTLSAAQAHLGIALINNALLPKAQMGLSFIDIGLPYAISPLSYFVIVSAKQTSVAVAQCFEKLLEMGNARIR